jgi:para-nitrobenzyl esterase
MKTIRRTDISRREFLGQAAMVAAAMHGHGMWAEGAGGDAVVKAPCGSLRGEVANGLRTFKGVPFAEPPIGMLRFKAPVKKRAWSGVRDAVKDGPVAMQGTETNEDSEDCLYLNVYTPIQVREPLPVWVSIHGGGFTGGRPTPEVVKFAKDGVVAVTVEYRLGVFGFLDVSPLLGTGCEADRYSARNSLCAGIVCAGYFREWRGGTCVGDGG